MNNAIKISQIFKSNKYEMAAAQKDVCMLHQGIDKLGLLVEIQYDEMW